MRGNKPIKNIGFILDGNRRWARAHQLPLRLGHRYGAENFKVIAKYVAKKNIPHLCAYVFSTENWYRKKTEVSYLMLLLRKLIKDLEKEFNDENIRIKIVGQKQRFPAKTQKLLEEVEEHTKNNTGTTLWIALSYGGQAEILSATNEIIKKSVSNVDEKTFKENLWSSEMPDLDIVIRTGGEKRISNFFLWHIAYAELFFIDKLWPDFTTSDLDLILEEYQERERRHGK